MTTTHRTIWTYFSLLSLLWLSTVSAQERRVVFGLLHAHTSYSDGSGTPQEAYRMARDAGLQFFAITEHNHREGDGTGTRKDGVLIANQLDLYSATADVEITAATPGGGTKTFKAASLIKASQLEARLTFVPLYGQEFSTISAGNHVNVLGFPSVLDIGKGDFASFYERIKQTPGTVPVVVQLNHPGAYADLFYASTDEHERFNDYGFDDFGHDFATLVQATDANVALIELLSGPALKAKQEKPYQPHENDYFFYLVQGYHISPSAGQDNHFPTWGKITNARMGAYVTELSAQALYEAFHENRTFATEDKDLQLSISINGSEMGSSISLSPDQELAIKVHVADAGESNKPVTVALYRGAVQPAKLGTLEKWSDDDGLVDQIVLAKAGTADFTGELSSGKAEFFYARVRQADGDRAWSGPIWINHPRQAATPTAASVGDYAWTKSGSSKLYHHHWCSAVDRIKPENLVRGNSGPPGRELHNCRGENEDLPH